MFLSLCVCPVMGVFPTVCDSHLKYRQKEEEKTKMMKFRDNPASGTSPLSLIVQCQSQKI